MMIFVTIVMFQMTRYNKFNLAFTWDKIFNGSGEARIPDYREYINAYKSYEEFLSNPVTSIFSHVKNMPRINKDGRPDFQTKKYDLTNSLNSHNEYIKTLSLCSIIFVSAQPIL